MPRDMWRTIRQAFSGWSESLRDSDRRWQVLRALLLVFCVSLVTGSLVALGLNWSAFSTYASQAATPAARQPEAQRAEAQRAPTWTATPAPLAGAATPSSTQAPPPTSPPQPVATVAPTSVPLPSAEQTWAAVQPRLDSVWGVDTQAAIVILDEFRARFPDYQPARDKLYAALIASAGELVRGGETQDAAEVLTRAAALAPDRIEGRIALQALTPTSTPVAPPEQEIPSVAGVQDRPQRSPTQVVRPQPAAPVRAAPTPVPRPAVVPPPVPQAPPPTPTKIPFRPPGGP